ncbi:1-aminocyclopropane-1-carboxylate oxidase 5-like [Papaver somniferum]|uniref:1-aminocyclopropane-1-carboxylate oxidase 5-like n=1 Tax=Papaver somniferum TaxID=3469 RepID=UPI000E6FF626|nr:1-aminocyclopropane-1-carboxylate oxidase 5-like [Papaver somniferum]
MDLIDQVEWQQVESLSSTDSKFSVKDFVWSQEEWPKIDHSDFESGDNIPMISLSKVIKGKKDDAYRQTCNDMVVACEKWGFFKLIGHGIKLEIIQNMKNMCSDLFDLPMEKKMKGGRLNCLPLGYSATNPDYGKNLPWAEIIQLLQSPQQVVGFATKVYGDQYHLKFSDAMLAYMDELDKLGMLIFEMLADGLGLPSDFFSRNFKEEKEATMIRVNRYPKCPLPEKCLGLGSHSDPHTLTILLQDDEVGGLQVLRPADNQWVGIRPIQNSFVINIGDTLEAWTNGRLKSVVHRAVVNKEMSRLSAAYFLSPSSQVMIESPPQLIQPISSNAKMYKPFTWGDFRKELLSQKRVSGKTALHRYLISP